MSLLVILLRKNVVILYEIMRISSGSNHGRPLPIVAVVAVVVKVVVVAVRPIVAVVQVVVVD